jgi:hypothetical protein
MVGNLDGPRFEDTQDKKVKSSGYGSRVDAFAPGGYTQCATSHEHQTLGRFQNDPNPQYWVENLNPHYATQLVAKAGEWLTGPPYSPTAGSDEIQVKDITIFRPGDKILLQDDSPKPAASWNSGQGSEYTLADITTIPRDDSSAGCDPNIYEIWGATPMPGEEGWWISTWFLKSFGYETGALYQGSGNWWYTDPMGWIYPLHACYYTDPFITTATLLATNSLGNHYVSSETMDENNSFSYSYSGIIGSSHSWLYWSPSGSTGVAAYVYNYRDAKWFYILAQSYTVAEFTSSTTPPPPPRLKLKGILKTTTNLTHGCNQSDDPKHVGLANERVQWGTGTSIAGPNLVGIIACWMEADPTLSIHDIRKLLRGNHARHDTMYEDPSTPMPSDFSTSGSYDAYASEFQTGNANRVVRQPDNSGQPMKRKTEN